jgi:hypothetical protein
MTWDITPRNLKATCNICPNVIYDLKKNNGGILTYYILDLAMNIAGIVQEVS